MVPILSSVGRILGGLSQPPIRHTHDQILRARYFEGLRLCKKIQDSLHTLLLPGFSIAIHPINGMIPSKSCNRQSGHLFANLKRKCLWQTGTSQEGLRNSFPTNPIISLEYTRIRFWCRITSPFHRIDVTTSQQML